MAITGSERRSRVVEALGFWLVTLLICAAAGLGSYRFGRHWIGDRLGGDVKSVLTTEELSNRVSQNAFTGANSADGSDVPDEPPKEAIVEVEPSEVSLTDRQRLRLEQKRKVGDAAGEDTPSDEGDREDEEPRREREPERETPANEASPTPRAERPSPSEVPSATEPAAAEHVVRAGSFKKSDNAERLVEELRGKGYQPFVTEAVVDGVAYQRVNVARYEDRDKALELRRELRSDGYAAEISSE